MHWADTGRVSSVSAEGFGATQTRGGPVWCLRRVSGRRRHGEGQFGVCEEEGAAGLRRYGGWGRDWQEWVLRIKRLRKIVWCKCTRRVGASC